MQERQVETNAEIQLDNASFSEKEQRTDLVAYMTTVSEEVQNDANAEIQLDTASSSEKEQRTDLVAYMTTVSEEVQNGADVNRGKEDIYHYIPDESDKYSQAYMDVKGQEDIQMTSDTTRSGNHASEEYYERVGNESGDDQQAYSYIDIARN